MNYEVAQWDIQLRSIVVPLAVIAGAALDGIPY